MIKEKTAQRLNEAPMALGVFAPFHFLESFALACVPFVFELVLVLVIVIVIELSLSSEAAST